ncbi:hypothetical protein [Fodinicola feengrottensis]|uniref:hypothetical protein n=1 Tax=Fodinicola feengrottensis TaxID=435914 RepID=UPI0013D496DE|nr:hypothetical protein [Fodinicola feengrottensis]
MRRRLLSSTAQIVLCIVIIGFNFMSGGWDNLIRRGLTVLMIGLLVAAIGQFAWRLRKTR